MSLFPFCQFPLTFVDNGITYLSSPRISPYRYAEIHKRKNQTTAVQILSRIMLPNAPNWALISL